MIKPSEIWNKFRNPLVIVTAITALVLALIALQYPRVINLTIELGHQTQNSGSSASSSAAPLDQAPRVRTYNAIRIGLVLSVISGFLIYLLWKTGATSKLISSLGEDARRKRWQTSIAIAIATIMIVGLMNYLMPKWVDLPVQLLLVLGIWTISLLVETETKKVRLNLAFLLGAFLIWLVIKNGIRSDGPIRLWWQQSLGNFPLGLTFFIVGVALLILGWMLYKAADPKKQFGLYLAGRIGLALGLICVLTMAAITRGWFDPSPTQADLVTKPAEKPSPVETITNTGWQIKVIWAQPGAYGEPEYIPGKDFVIQPEGLVKIKPQGQAEYLDGPGLKNPPLTFTQSDEAYCRFKAEGKRPVRVKIGWRGSWAVEAINVPLTKIAKPE